jgi:hypothetical protein
MTGTRHFDDGPGLGGRRVGEEHVGSATTRSTATVSRTAGPATPRSAQRGTVT